MTLLPPCLKLALQLPDSVSEPCGLLKLLSVDGLLEGDPGAGELPLHLDQPTDPLGRLALVALRPVDPFDQRGQVGLELLIAMGATQSAGLGKLAVGQPAVGTGGLRLADGG